MASTEATIGLGQRTLSPALHYLSYAGLVYLAGFACLFLLNFAGLVG